MDNSYGFLQLPCVSYLDRFRHWTYDVIFSGQCNPTDSHSKINFTFFFFTIVFYLSLTSVPSGKQHYFHGSIFTDRSCPYSFYLSLLIYFFFIFFVKKGNIHFRYLATTEVSVS